MLSFPQLQKSRWLRFFQHSEVFPAKKTKKIKAFAWMPVEESFQIKRFRVTQTNNKIKKKSVWIQKDRKDSFMFKWDSWSQKCIWFKAERKNGLIRGDVQPMRNGDGNISSKIWWSG